MSGGGSLEPPPFYQAPLARVRSNLGASPKEPSVEVVEDNLLVYFRLVDAKMGSFQEVQQLDTRTVLQRLYWEKFNSDYERSMVELNKT